MRYFSKRHSRYYQVFFIIIKKELFFIIQIERKTWTREKIREWETFKKVRYQENRIKDERNYYGITTVRRI